MLLEVAAEHGLSAVEVHVVVERMTGRSYAEIAGDAVLGGRSRQMVQKIEQRAARKLGLVVSVEVAVNAAERLDAGLRMQQRARLLGWRTGMRLTRSNTPHQRLRPRERRAMESHERAVARFLKSKGCV